MTHGLNMREYESALTGAALFDRSSTGKLVLSGPDAPSFLHNLCTNSVKDLPLGGGAPAYFCDPRGKVQFQAIIYHVRLADGPAMWLETTPSHHQDMARYLDRYLISERVTITDRTDDFAQFHLAGPAAKSILENAIGASLPEIDEYQHMERTIGTEAVANLRRRDPLGLPGYDVVCLSSLAEEVRQRLQAGGAVLAGNQTFETLRVEAGTPVFGLDIDSNRFVMEVSDAARCVSYSKGCFLGQEPIVMARDRAGHVNRSLRAVKVLEGGPLMPGTKLIHDGLEVGQSTSSVYSPRLAMPIALCYLRWKHQDPGLRLLAESPQGRQAVEVLSMPPIPHQPRFMA